MPEPRTPWRDALATAAKLGLAASMWWVGIDLAQAATPPATTVAAPAAAIDAAALYRQHCAACHGMQRTGGMGPALLPESLERLKPADALATIARGRDATQMPGFGGVLSEAEVAAVAAHIRTPVLPAPRWSDADIRASRLATPLPPNEPVRPAWSADPMNLFVVVEGGDHHVSLLDGDRFEVIHRFASRYALHGGPKFTPDGRHVFFGSRDGWITKYDLWRLKVVAEVRAGLNMRNIAVSADGRFVAAANYLPHSVVLFDSDLRLLQTLPATNAAGSESSRVSAVYDAAPRQSFIVALKDTAELWELPYGAHSPLARGKPSAPVRTPLDGPLDDFFFDPPYKHVLGATRPASGARADAASAQVIDLDARRKVADLGLAGMPHLGSGIAFTWQGRTVLASPNLRGGGIDVIDLASFKPVTTIPTPGPGFFLRSHEASPYAWADSMMGPKSKDTLTVIDKATLKPIASVREPGKTLAHIEFTRDGRFALASVWEMDGALVVYDAQTLKEVKRLPMKKPVGKYNVWNKITRSEGTSH